MTLTDRGHVARAKARRHRRATVAALLMAFVCCSQAAARPVSHADRPSAARERADLQIEGIILNTRIVTAERQVRTTIVVRNRGRKTSRRFELGYALGATPRQARAATLRRLMPRWAVGRRPTVRRRIRIVVPSDTPPRRYYVRVCADTTNVVRERSERNNCRISHGRIEVTPGPAGPNQDGSDQGSGGPQGCTGVTALAADPRGLAGWLDDNVLHNRFPQRGSEQYDVVPAGPAGDPIRNPVTTAMRHIMSGALVPASMALATLPPPAYRVACLREPRTGRTLFVLWEPRVEASPHGWGVLVWAPTGTRNIAIEAPHTKADAASEYLAIETFLRADARALLIAGAHRRAFDIESQPADVAHDPHSVFEAIHRQTLAAAPFGVVVQLHGFCRIQDQETCPNGHEDVKEDVVVSSGTGTATGATATIVTRLSEEGITATSTARGLEGTQNVQGHSTLTAGWRFVHIEVERSLRVANDRPNRARIEALSRAIAAGLHACLPAAC